MEILNETTHWFGFIACFIVIAIASLLMLVFGIIEVVTDWKIGNSIAEGALLTIGGLVIGVVTYLGAASGPPVEIEAIVTDYNVVYEKGYEVVGQRGEITILEERD